MGNSNTKEHKKNPNGEKLPQSIAGPKKSRVLLLHGSRTSGRIFMMQTAAMRYHVQLDAVAVDAPFLAEGPPDEGIATFYPDQPYYEWYVKRPSVGVVGLDKSISYIISLLENDTFVGIVGFSQGAAMTTIIAKYLLANRDKCAGILNKLKFLMLIGGVNPPARINGNSDCTMYANVNEDSIISIPSIHIIGNADQYKPRSEKLIETYSDIDRLVLYHEEGHNIPSIRTELYPRILEWVENHTTSAKV